MDETLAAGTYAPSSPNVVADVAEVYVKVSVPVEVIFAYK